MNAYVVDTHALLWHLQNDKRLGAKAAALFGEADVYFFIPTIVLCELSRLSLKGKSKHNLQAVIDILHGDPRFEIVSLDEATVSLLPPQLEIHDAIIVATVLALKKSKKITAKLITWDSMISKSGLVETVW